MATRPLIGLNCEYEKTPRGTMRYSTPAAYVEAVLAAGGLPVLIPNLPDAAARREFLASMGGLVFIGGDDIDPKRWGEAKHPTVECIHPDKEEADLALMRDAVAADKPFLGICGGCQLLNVALGGSLVQDIPSMVAKPLQHKRVENRDSLHPVRVRPGTRLAGIVGAGEIETNSAHHQSVNRLGDGLVQTADAPDGVVEAVEFPGKRFAVGVQWHPERIADRDHSQKLFRSLIAEAARK